MDSGDFSSMFRSQNNLWVFIADQFQNSPLQREVNETAWGGL